MLRRVKLLILLFYVLSDFSANAEELKVIELSDTISQLKIESSLYIKTVKDNPKASLLTLDEEGYRLFNQNELFFDYSGEKIYWIKFKVKNNSLNISRYLLEISNPTVNKIHFFSPLPGGAYKEFRTGDSYSFNSREIESRIFLFDLNIAFDEEKIFYLYVNTEGDKVTFPISIWDPKDHAEKSFHEQYIFGVFFGILLLIILLHFFLYFNLKDIAHIYYLLYVTGLSVILLTLDGLFFQYFIPDLPWLAERLMVLSVYFTMVFLIIFTQIYLDTRNSSIRFHKFLSVLKYINLAGLLGTLGPASVFFVCLHASTIIAPLINLVVITSAIVAFKNNRKLAVYFIAAFALLIFGVVIVTLKSNGLLSGFPLKDYGFKMGVVAEIVTLSFALTVRFKMMQEETQALALDRLQKLNELKDQQNVKLEQMVAERTLEINAQKEIIEKKNIKITHSILYAKRIQDSLLPAREQIMEVFPNSFILYKPKDIVSGDFYWFTTKGDLAIIAVVDCTGHGVPGAFMSMLGSSLLNQIVKINGVTQTDQILNHLNNGVRLALRQENGYSEAQDGMDIAICSINCNSGKVQFSGAKRPMYYISNDGSLEVFQGNKFPIGGSLKLESPFSNNDLNLNKGDTIYLFTDGYIDQFGGENDGKYMSKKFRDVLSSIHPRPMSEQEKVLDSEIEEWKGGRSQTDDILVMGIKI
ncbi:MAG TPA: 7TM diverse intracellular signaling domain-containing protein [Cytophagales bacterium]|nr:7TM diverse intracellular signaling domain-containing protein [Cytophagales bacterium]